jgi:hypothetical protein
MLVVQMGTAIYVHLQPQVPANVLPLGIKAPVIPVVVLLLALLTAFAVWKERRAEKASDMPRSGFISDFVPFWPGTMRFSL